MPENSTNVLQTNRIILRPLVPDDLDDFLEYRSDPETARYQGWEPFEIKDAQEYILKYKDNQPGIENQWVQYGIELIESKKLIGDCAFRVTSFKTGEIGCTLNRLFRGKGYAVEALHLMFRYMYSTLDVHRIVGISDAENLPSIGLMERAGMRKEGHFIQNIWFKGKWGDEVLYALLKKEWEKCQM